MSLNAIVSYDGTNNDDDALMLARILGDAGASLTLAYVRHSLDAGGGSTRESDADMRLERGAMWLGDLNLPQRVVINPSTSAGLCSLAAEENAQLIIFGSDYRTAPRHVAPGRSTQALLEGGPAALAIAPAAYHDQTDLRIARIGVLSGDDMAAEETACGLAERLGAEVTAGTRGVDLLVVGSRPEAPEATVMLTARAHRAVEDSSAPVLVLARGVPLSFPALMLA